MTLGNMRELGVQRLIASCLNDACRHTALIDVSSYPVETEVPYFRSRVVCGSRGNKIDVRPNWKEQSPATGAWSTRKGGSKRKDVRSDVLGPSERHTQCPYKGVAAYHTVTIGGERYGDLVWYYPDPIGVPEDHGAACVLQ